MRATVAALAAALVLCAAGAYAQQGITCQFEAQQYTSYDALVQCFFSVPINLDVKQQTIDSLRRALQLYTFLDIAVESPSEHLPVSVDMLAGLDAIAARPYKYDYEFHDDLRALFLKLYDAHTQYYAPSCYNQFLIRQPFAPVSYVDDTGRQVVAIGPWYNGPLAQYYRDTTGVDVKAYAGAVIEQVDGVAALEYFYTYANESVGMSKDPGTRFNMVMSRPEPRPDMVTVAQSYWATRTQRNPIPRRPYVDYELRLPNGTATALTLPWSILAQKTYTGVDSFLADYWAAPSSAAAATDAAADAVARPRVHAHAPPPVVDDMAMRDVEVSPLYRDMDAIAARKQSSRFTNLVNGTQLSFWQLDDNETLVMYLDTFGPDSLVDTYTILNEGFQAAADRKLSRFIIDLTNNGGGSICLGRSLIAYLQANGTNYGPEDLACSPLQKQLTENAVAMDQQNTVWSPSFYANHNNDPIAPNDTSYLIPGVPHVRGGRLRNYTRLVHIGGNCGEFGYRIDPAIKFNPEEIIIVTHGFCGSTCALFSTHLALYDSVRTFVMGGIDGHEQQFFSFPGGQVLDTPGLFATIAQLGFNTTAGPAAPDELQPRALPTTAAYRFCVREVYPNKPVAYSTPPMEFAFQPGSYRASYSYQTAVAPEFGWYEAAAHFGPGNK